MSIAVSTDRTELKSRITLKKKKIQTLQLFVVLNANFMSMEFLVSVGFEFLCLEIIRLVYLPVIESLMDFLPKNILLCLY